jgi:hypothetical protein
VSNRGVWQREQPELTHADDLIEIVDRVKLRFQRRPRYPVGGDGSHGATELGLACSPLAAARAPAAPRRPPAPRIPRRGCPTRPTTTRRRRMGSQATGRIPPPTFLGKGLDQRCPAFAGKNTPAAHTAAPVIPPEPRIRAPDPVIPHPAHLRRARSFESLSQNSRGQEPP